MDGNHAYHASSFDRDYIVQKIDTQSLLEEAECRIDVVTVYSLSAPRLIRQGRKFEPGFSSTDDVFMLAERR